MSNDMGGPAFPTKVVQNTGLGSTLTHTVTPGMTLWDYFAAHALMGLMSGVTKLAPDSPGGGFAYFAGELADAMLDERRKRMSAKDEPRRESSIEKDGSG